MIYIYLKSNSIDLVKKFALMISLTMHFMSIGFNRIFLHFLAMHVSIYLFFVFLNWLVSPDSTSLAERAVCEVFLNQSDILEFSSRSLSQKEELCASGDYTTITTARKAFVK